MGDQVVDCENDHIFHSNCFEDKVENQKICPVCSCPMVCEEEMQEGGIQSVNSSVLHLSPQLRNKQKPKATVTFADLPTEPSSKTKDNAPSAFPL